MKRFAACCGWLAALFCLSFTLSASAETLLVDPSGGAGAYDSVTAALAAARDGDTVLLAGGVYDETRERFPIMIDQSVALVAAEGETPVIRSPKLMAAMKITAAGASVSGLTFEFLRSGLWVLADDVAVADCAFTLADEIWRTSSCGMWVGGAKRMRLTDSAFSGCGIALAGPPIGESSKGLPVLTGMFEVGEDRAFFNTHVIEGNTVNGKPLRYLLRQTGAFSAECGQLIAVECDDLTVSGVDVSRASIGVELAYCKNSAVEGVTADQCGIFGIYLAKSDECAVRNTRANGCAHGIDLRAVQSCVVSDCVAQENGQGVFFSFAWNGLVTRSRMIDNGTGFFSASGDDNQMDACRVEGNEIGLYIQHEPTFLMTNSEIVKNTACGARILNGGFLCVDNLFEENWVASMALGVDHATYIGNVFRGNVNRALYVRESKRIKLLGNDYAEPDAALREWIESETPLTEGEPPVSGGVQP